ncbi:MAG: hypothetical protein MUF34_30500 [Polyangiaceae bacterium]|jgi:hypothetical protein|nr:hypothetical protein [Polyangiaceae bacterium]
MIDSLISQRSQGNPILKTTTTTKLILRGIDPARYTATSDDDREVIEKLRAIAAEMNVRL